VKPYYVWVRESSETPKLFREYKGGYRFVEDEG
jgi:hypothetical protein